jgi:predicted extracellular nuclease
MKKIKFIKAFNVVKVGTSMEVELKIAEYLVANGFAKLSDCGGGCEECEDCKGKKKKKASTKKVVKSKTVKKSSSKKS